MDKLINSFTNNSTCTCFVNSNYELYMCNKNIGHDNHRPLCVCGDRLRITIACGCHYFCEKCQRCISNIGCHLQE